MKNILLITIIILFTGCDFGPPAKLNEDFVHYNLINKDLPFTKLIGKYKLDKDSKVRYNIPDSLDFYIELGVKNKKDTFLSANRYISPLDRSIMDERLDDIKIMYYENGKDINSLNRKLIGTGNISVYMRKQDSVLALYVYTPPTSSKKNDTIIYLDGDYLRYIKQ